jgi:hypothetical protein
MEAAIVSLLAPFLPHLLRVGQRTADNAVDALTTEAGRRAQALWQKLRPHVESRPAASEAASDVAANPEDQRARGAFELQLQKLLDRERQLRDEVKEMIREAERAGVLATDGGVAIGGDVHASDGSIGVIGKVEGNFSMPQRGRRKRR